jgi:hypothetical protein
MFSVVLMHISMHGSYAFVKPSPATPSARRVSPLREPERS